jgi:hypothetical protein
MTSLRNFKYLWLVFVIAFASLYVRAALRHTCSGLGRTLPVAGHMP